MPEGPPVISDASPNPSTRPSLGARIDAAMTVVGHTGRRARALGGALTFVRGNQQPTSGKVEGDGAAPGMFATVKQGLQARLVAPGGGGFKLGAVEDIKRVAWGLLTGHPVAASGDAGAAEAGLSEGAGSSTTTAAGAEGSAADAAQTPEAPLVGKRGLVLRWVLALPVALVASLLVMGALPHVMPEGSAGVDHLVIPVMLFPGIWGGLVFYVVWTERLGRASMVMASVMVLSLAAIGTGFL